ncbi:MAG: hypothetical protein HC921_20530, partial [Synechococcaceae cyanobacterium SM2_3_1]|nr:hypothetical protein [Synechococcaceae cyanobacterium SM2_3_1]
MRTTVKLVENEPVQLIIPTYNWKLNTVDICDVDDTKQGEEIFRHLQELNSIPFDLRELPIFRMKLIRISHDRYILAFVLHHFVFDGWSINLFFHELSLTYSNLTGSQAESLEPLTVQYADYVIWQRDTLASQHFKVMESFWKDQLKNLDRSLSLPTEDSFSGSYEGESIPFVLPQDLSKRVRQYCAYSKTTLYSYLLSALKILLHSYTGQNDLLILTPVACRNSKETESLIGYINNILPVRTIISDDLTCDQVIKRVQKSAANIYKYQEYPLELIMTLPEVRRISLTRCVFNFGPDLNLPLQANNSFRVSLYRSTRTTTNFDLFLNLVDNGDDIAGVVEYKTSIFNEEQISLLINNYVKTLETMVISPDVTLLDLRKSINLVDYWPILAIQNLTIVLKVVRLN